MFSFLWCSDPFRHAVEFAAGTGDLALDVLLLPAAHVRQSLGQPPAGAAQDSGRHLQIALQPRGLGGIPRGSWPLRFEKQFRRGQDALANHSRSRPPGSIQLPGLPRVAGMLHEGCRHLLAVFQADAGYRYQELHGHMGRDFAFTHLLLDGLWQQLNQRQAPRHPAHAAVEAARQRLQSIAEALLQLGQ
jgi:hypothetical protein